MIFDDDNFFDIVKSYPLGIVKFDNQIIVRDPLYTYENENMFLGGNIPQNSIINILKGEVNSLIKSSGIAVKELVEKLNPEENQDVILFNCITRSVFLKDDFVKELDEIKSHMKSNSTLFGALTLGEIVGTQRIWPARAFTLGHLTHNDLATVRIAKRATKSL